MNVAPVQTFANSGALGFHWLTAIDAYIFTFAIELIAMICLLLVVNRIEGSDRDDW